MTAFPRFDPFERRIADAVDEIAAARRPDYLDDILRQTARTAQRPRWIFLERWLPMDTALTRPGAFGRRLPLRPLVVLALVLALVAGAVAVYFGSQPELLPYGPAANGQLVFGMDGDLYVAESLSSTPRLLLGGPDAQQGVILSPNGRLVAYDDYSGTAGPETGANPHEWVSELDGSNPRQILDRPYTFESFEWSPDSRSIAIVTKPNGLPELWIAPADGSGATQVAFDSMFVWRAAWDPMRDGVLLALGEDRDTHLSDLYYINTDGAILDKLGVPSLNINGAGYELSGATFSPDGKTIAYNSVVAREDPVNRFRAHLMDRDGTNDREIPAPLATLYSQAWPSFSPDGAWVLLTTWETKSDGSVVFQLAVAPTDGSAAARRIGPIVDDDNQLKAWSPDGTTILFCACEHGEIYTVDPVTGTAVKHALNGDMPSWQRLAR